MKNLFTNKKALMITIFSLCFAVGIVVLVVSTMMSSDAKDIESSKEAKKEKVVDASEKPLDSEKSKDDKVVKKESKDNQATKDEDEGEDKEQDKEKNTEKAVVTDSNADTKKDNGKKKAYLTFDDGPSDATPKILAILDKYNVKATFFVTNQFGQSDNQYKEIADKGHTVALHSASHAWSIYRNKEAYYKDLNRISDIVERATGKKSKIVRFPGGSSNTRSKKECRGIMSVLAKDLNAKGYKYQDWNVSDGDANGNNIPKAKLVQNVKNESKQCEKDICILMHDTSYKAKRTTVEALPEIIEYLQGAGYEILPIDEETSEFHHPINN